MSITSGGAESYLANMYICDSTTGPGSYACNTFLGDVRTAALFPTSNGTVSWTPLTGSNWSEVNEVAFDGDSSYNYTSAAGNQDILNFGSLVGTVSGILAVAVTGAYRKDDAGTHTLAQQIVSSGTQEAGATISVPGTYVYDTDVFVLDPATGASWTVTGVNALKAGYKLLS
jgi:hypothetical protein